MRRDSGFSVGDLAKSIPSVAHQMTLLHTVRKSRCTGWAKKWHKIFICQ